MINKRILALEVILGMVLLCGCGNAGSDKLKNQNKVEETINAQILEEDSKNASEETTTEKITTELTEEMTEEKVTENVADKEDSGNVQTDLDKVNDTIVDKESEYEVIDIDLTQMSSDMVYATVYQMMLEPESFVGKTVKMQGQYYPMWYDVTAQYYHYIMIADAAACCQQGIEFVWGDGSHVYPDEYPEEGTLLEATGVFELYEEEENGVNYTYCRLQDSQVNPVK